MASPPVSARSGSATPEPVDKLDRFLLLSDSRAGDEPQEVIPIRDNEVLKIGRDPNAECVSETPVHGREVAEKQQSLFIKHDPDNVVSRLHCEVYVVVYDESTSHVYVQDRKSSNGTYVNGRRVGNEHETSSGYLLEDGDVVDIQPFWTLTFRDSRVRKTRPMTTIQAEECKFFADKYHITQRCLGEGGDGVVYLAREVSTRKQLVCKVINLKKIKGRNAPEELRRKLQEADVLRQLQHPNILPYVDAVISPNTLFTFTELATGGDLWSFIHQHDCVDELETRVIVRQVVRALDYIHSKGVIHRDLKPENILLAYTPKINCHRVMLSDFGACAVPRRSRMVTQAGTVNYQAPEVYTKNQPQTAAVDMWSLGVVALTMLTNHMGVPLVGLDRLGQQQLEEFLKLNVFDELGRFSSNCERFVSECLQASPSGRMSSREAWDHDWLWTPEPHLEYFQSLDRKSMSCWKAEEQLRPMPFELPDVLTEKVSVSDMEQRQLRLSDRFTPAEEHSDLKDEKSRFFQGFVGPDQDMPDGEAADSDWDTTLESLSDSSATVTSPLELPLEITDKEGEQAVQAAQGATAITGPSAGRLRRSKLRIQDAVLLPLAGLDKHRNRGPAPVKDRREQVLEELKKRNAKFLPDVSSLPTLASLRGNGKAALGQEALGKMPTSLSSPALLR